jgi:hypothetical protein
MTTRIEGMRVRTQTPCWTKPVPGYLYVGNDPVNYVDPSGLQGVIAGVPVGHHWVPIYVITHPDLQSLLSEEAKAYASGSTSGPTNKQHGYGEYGGVKHSDYNKFVKDELQKFAKGKKMSGKDMEKFAGLIQEGKDAAGKEHPQIKAFNDAIKKDVKSCPTGNYKDIVDAGRRIMKSPRFFNLGVGAALAHLLSESVSAQAQVLDVTASSGHYSRAMNALAQGDLATAQRLLTGGQNSLYMEILTKVGAQAALNFKNAMDDKFSNGR